MTHQSLEVLFGLGVVCIGCFAPYQFRLARVGIVLIGATGMLDGLMGPARGIPTSSAFFVGTVLIGLAAFVEIVKAHGPR